MQPLAVFCPVMALLTDLAAVGALPTAPIVARRRAFCCIWRTCGHASRGAAFRVTYVRADYATRSAKAKRHG